MGEQVVVKLEPGHEPRRLKGLLVAVDGDVATVEASEIDGIDLDEPRRHEVALPTLASARTVFEWGPKPKPGQPGARRRKSTHSAPAGSEPSDHRRDREVNDEQ